jgi:UDP-2-acetamido-2,6-beta-L-arabino-hexul-4-ose reductase
VRVLITGSNGFIGKNLKLHLSEQNNIEVLCLNRNEDPYDSLRLLRDGDFIVHLAGVNRPGDAKEFISGNIDLTRSLCEAMSKTGLKISVIYASSIQADKDSPYGDSKRESEKILTNYGRENSASIYLFRLPNVFGKWCDPNYNSVVATFCYNTAHDLPIRIDDPMSLLELVYVDDVVECFSHVIHGNTSIKDARGFELIHPRYLITVGELANQIQVFKKYHATARVDRVGSGLLRALYSTYLSYLPPSRFINKLNVHRDERGCFIEVIQTLDSGQVSHFTAFPGITRGGHYHHSKTEKFLVVKGQARFRFRHMITAEIFTYETDHNKFEIVQSIPGWIHDITNIGDDEMLVMLWANEVFDIDSPDTYSRSLDGKNYEQ